MTSTTGKKYRAIYIWSNPDHQILFLFQSRTRVNLAGFATLPSAPLGIRAACPTRGLKKSKIAVSIYCTPHSHHLFTYSLFSVWVVFLLSFFPRFTLLYHVEQRRLPASVWPGKALDTLPRSRPGSTPPSGEVRQGVGGGLGTGRNWHPSRFRRRTLGGVG